MSILTDPDVLWQARLQIDVEATAADGTTATRAAGMVLVVVGVRPDTALAAEAGATLGARGAIAVHHGMRTNLADVFEAIINTEF